MGLVRPQVSPPQNGEGPESKGFVLRLSRRQVEEGSGLKYPPFNVPEDVQ